MKTMQTTIAALTIALAAAGAAWAHSPCCEGKSCPSFAYPIPDAGAAPADARCCTDATLTNCQAAPNVGWACSMDTAGNAQALPGRQAVAGCEQDETSGACIGGSVDMAGPHGCVGVGLAYVTGASTGATAEDCTNSAVDACCAAGACELAPAD